MRSNDNFKKINCTLTNETITSCFYNHRITKLQIFNLISLIPLFITNSLKYHSVTSLLIQYYSKINPQNNNN